MKQPETIFHRKGAENAEKFQDEPTLRSKRHCEEPMVTKQSRIFCNFLDLPLRGMKANAGDLTGAGGN
ncbi:MAG: hypothetical protein NPINA01_02130 [Nitrospinaceae bacterium]|nr:MAG: hypothetical protein NPINA01_02130 [Nitrospinaceae bacterium]